MSKSTLTSQYKWNMDTGSTATVGSKATERPVREKQASLLSWEEEIGRLERWNVLSQDDERGAEMHTLYTIGYGGSTPEKVAARLHEQGIDVLLDVRAMPRTRIPGFSKNQLSRFMLEQGITYSHVEALGNLNRNAGPDAPVVLVNEEHGLQILRGALGDHPVAIMCAEKSHVGCHRHDIAYKMQDQIPSLVVERLVP